jgi:hypothetical protein
MLGRAVVAVGAEAEVQKGRRRKMLMKMTTKMKTTMKMTMTRMSSTTARSRLQDVHPDPCLRLVNLLALHPGILSACDAPSALATVAACQASPLACHQVPLSLVVRMRTARA